MKCVTTSSVTAVTWVHPLSSGSDLGLSGFPQLSGLRMDARTSPPSRQDGFIPGRGHSDASAAIAEEKLPNAAQHQLRDRLRLRRCFLSSERKVWTFTLLRGKPPRSLLCRRQTLPPLILNHWGEKKGRRRGRGSLRQEEERQRKQDLKETWQRSLSADKPHRCFVLLFLSRSHDPWWSVSVQWKIWPRHEGRSSNLNQLISPLQSVDRRYIWSSFRLKTN